MADSLQDFPLKGSLALVTGATGFTGAVVINKLIEQGARVRAIARPSSSISQFEGMSIDWIRGQVFDRPTILQAVEGVDYIFHVAAAYREAGITDETYRLVHVESTKLLAEAGKHQLHLKRFVHVSTVGVHGHIDSPPANEDYRFSPGDVYQETKAEAEIWIREFGSRENFPVTVIRPAAIYGPGDRRLLKVFKMAAKKFFPLFGAGKGLYHLIHVEDLANIILLAASHPRAIGEVFIAGNSVPTSLHEMALVISDELSNKNMTFLRLPVWPLFALASLCETICKPLGLDPPIYKRRVAFFTKDRAFDTTKVHSLLGYCDQYDNEGGLRSTAKWYRSAGWV